MILHDVKFLVVYDKLFLFASRLPFQTLPQKGITTAGSVEESIRLPVQDSFQRQYDNTNISHRNL